MSLQLGGSKNKSKTSGTQTQQFDQTSTSSLSPRAFDAISGRAGLLGQRQYQGLDPNAYKDFMNPYQQEVIDATTADIGAQRELAENAQRSDVAAAGAFGDKRRGIMEAELGGQYDRTLATTVAGLRSRGFEGAQGVAASENSNRNQFDQNTEALLNQLYALLGNETTTRNTGTSSGTSTGRSSGYNLGFSFEPFAPQGGR